jgi:predicted phage terminase large subunit-like protein
VGIEWSGTLELVELAGDTSIKFTSIKGGLTGHPIDGVCIIDDPIKGQREARSATIRKDTIAWWKTEARSRRHQGTSYVVMATRWHVADLTGYLTKEAGWQYLNFKAIAEPANDNGVDDLDAAGRILSDPLHRFPGESLSPRKPPEFFAEEQKDAFWWASMYQGQPRPDGGVVFQSPTTWVACGAEDDNGKRCGKPASLCGHNGPAQGYRVGWGVDLAYTAKTSAHFSVGIEGWMTVVRELGADGKMGNVHRLYVIDVQRKQVDAPAFTLTLKSMTAGKHGPMRFYCATSEQGGAQFVKQKISRLEIKLASADKLVRATPVSAAWNAGRVLVPESADWLEDFVDEVTAFTGVRDPVDDQVDALAALWDALLTGSTGQLPKTTGGTTRWDGSGGRGF